MSVLGAGIARCAPSSTRGVGRTQCFVGLMTVALDSGFLVRTRKAGASKGHMSRRVVYVKVGEDLECPFLVSTDIVMVSSDAPPKREAATRTLGATTQVAWNNPETVPVSVRVRVLLVHDEVGDLEASGAQTDTVVDISALDFADEIAYPDELYDRRGVPERDPAQRP